MSKKMMKRSLALGALMAFVITGSAFAEAERVTGFAAATGENNSWNNIDWKYEAGQDVRVDGIYAKRGGHIDILGDANIVITGSNGNDIISAIKLWDAIDNDIASSMVIVGKTNIEVSSDKGAAYGIEAMNNNKNIETLIFKDDFNLIQKNTVNYIGTVGGNKEFIGVLGSYANITIVKSADIYLENNISGSNTDQD